MASDQSEVFPEEKLTFRGMELIFRPALPGVKKAFTSYLESVAVRSLARHRIEYTPDDYMTSLKNLPISFASKVFNWGRKDWQDALQDDENLQELAFLMLTQEISPGMKLNEIDRKTVKDLWDEQYWNDGDLFCQELLAKGIGPEYITFGAKITNIMTTFINRPNSRPPVTPGVNGASQSNTTTSKSVPDSQTTPSA